MGRLHGFPTPHKWDLRKHFVICWRGCICPAGQIPFYLTVEVWCAVAQSCLTLCNPVDYNPPGSSVHGIFQARILGAGCHFLLQCIFPTQGWNPHLFNLLPWQVASSPLCHLGSPLQVEGCIISYFWLRITCYFFVIWGPAHLQNKQELAILLHAGLFHFLNYKSHFFHILRVQKLRHVWKSMCT